MSSGQRLRQAIRDEILQIPGAPNALMARLIEQHGFDAIYLSGAAFSAGHLAIPDIGLFSLTELAQQTAILAESTVLPVIVDADTGFGDTVNVERTIVELERSGAAAIQLEDQELPKRCGHLSGKQLVSSEEMCRKLRAAVAARRDPDLVLSWNRRYGRQCPGARARLSDQEIEPREQVTDCRRRTRFRKEYRSNHR